MRSNDSFNSIRYHLQIWKIGMAQIAITSMPLLLTKISLRYNAFCTHRHTYAHTCTNTHTHTYTYAHACTHTQTYFPAFESCAREGQAASIMCSYNEVNGVPSCANDLFLNNVVRDQWGFGGFIVSLPSLVPQMI